MSDPESVKRALSRLASRPNGAGPVLDSETEYRRVIDDASSAVGRLAAAATFVDEVGLEGLTEAVAAAESADDHAAARRGREALAQFRAFRQACNGGHSCSGRGTTLGAGCKRGDE